MIDNATKENLKQKIRFTQEELVKLSFSGQKDPDKHESLLKSLNRAREELSQGLYRVR